jgi:hypothetical protein
MCKGGKIYIQVMIPVSSSNINRTFGPGRVFSVDTVSCFVVLSIYLRAHVCVCVCVIQWDLIARHGTGSID